MIRQSAGTQWTDNLHKPITIEIAGHNSGICKTGIPFPAGQLHALNQLKLFRKGMELPAFARPLCFWQDGTIRWATLGFFHSASSEAPYELFIADTPATHTGAEPQLCEVQRHAENIITIPTEGYLFLIDLEELSLTVKARDGERRLLHIPALGSSLTMGDGRTTSARLKQWKTRPLQDLSDGSHGALELEIIGETESSTAPEPLQFTTVIELYRSLPFIKIQTTLHNPNPAQHPNGIWDLGDDGSTHLHSRSFEIELDQGESVSHKPAPYLSALPTSANTKLVQFSSGGIHWHSPNHVDRENKISLNKKGYEITIDGQPYAQGDRATPLLKSTSGIEVTVEKFWQNFPASIESTDNVITLGLFPSLPATDHELQGGERKSHTFWINLNGETHSLDWVHEAPIAKPDNSWLALCGALPLFHSSTGSDPIVPLITTGVEHDLNFFAKRELIDEYGWRNFGDLYADHETAGYDGKEPFISHYNNQYDPIYGFLRQFLRTGDRRWFELADDLARHVKDIDIYHTNGDKEEYNGGLFWHTDHYLKAYTSTHRSYSKFQGNTAYENRSGGGGPGGQHCYTSGLTYHYLLTGAEDSREAVLTLSNWISRVYDGTGSCLEFLLAVKNRYVPYLKNPISGRYPFDRGTANYVISLLDCHRITGEKSYLQRVEHIIRNTVHPADNIAARDLLNAEECWYYTVFLQALCRYLAIKEEMKAFDASFLYARDTLLHYADWMVESEYPYLEKPEILEFPNDTWAAQDLRKADVLAAAFYYSSGQTQPYLERARYFQEYVATRLSSSPELAYTRILALLMLNHGAIEYYTSLPMTEFPERQNNWPAAKYQKSPGLTMGVVAGLGKRLLNLSIKKEARWLQTHLGN